MSLKFHWSFLWSVAALCLALACGCSPTVPRTPLICPTPPTPQCQPQTFDKVLLDTNFHGVGHTQSHITMLPVPINGAADDNAITFLPTPGGELALISSDRSTSDAIASHGVQRVFSAKFIRTTEFGTLNDVESGEARVPFGSGYYCEADHLFYFAAKANNSDPDDFDIYEGRPNIGGDHVALSDVHPIAALNSTGHFDSQPTLDGSGRRIYFVSDRPGGSGGTDIWYAERASTTTQSWSEPQALPPPINSECDEISPYISATDPTTFYFSSNGHATVGGYDIFRSKMHDGQFGEPQNLGIPINTKYDEIFPVALNDTAFFWSSNMPASEGGTNLYTITRTHLAGFATNERVTPERPETHHLQEDTAVIPKGPVRVDVRVTRGAQFHPAEGAEVFVRKDSLEVHRKILGPTGTDRVVLPRDQYDVGAETKDAFFDVRRIDLRTYKDSIATVDLHLPDTLTLRINFPFDDYQHPYEYMIDENGQPSTMTWREGLDLTAQAVKASLDRMRELVLIGHTDSLGSDAYNERLGYRRATFVASELEKRGVPKKLMRVVSRGRTQPVDKRPAESDELFRLRSRRVEFVKVFK